ncbi:MAG: ribosome biogenesis GTPase YlqF [Clostridiales bacterium]|nr:ribosome biogenesis GTPase YlqF [Clostridiales bacterium]
MDIHWFPGHMTKSLRMMQENVKLVDIIFYVVDARAPKSCINPAFTPIIANKKIVYVLNKADMVAESDLNFWLTRLKSMGDDALALNSTAAKSSLNLINIAKRLCKDKIERYQQRGIKTSIRAMVIGVPNSGKSTLINNLCGKSSTITGNKAGVTRGKQWVRISDYFEVLDTPGTLYPKLNDQVAAARLAFIGSIKDEVVDKNELAYLLIAQLISINPKIITDKYNITINDDNSLIMSDIARSRGYLMKGNQPDIDRTTIAIIDDFRKGRMGKICLDRE